MTLKDDVEACRTDTTSRWASLLFGSAGLCFIAVGGLLWMRDGATAFRDVVVGALTWCF